jgi:hypothetical protein
MIEALENLYCCIGTMMQRFKKNLIPCNSTEVFLSKVLQKKGPDAFVEAE